MATWIEKLSKAADTAINKATDIANATNKTFQEKGVDGIIEKSTDILVKTGKTLEKEGQTLATKTKAYVKDISESNKQIVKDVEKNMGKNNLDSKIAQGIAATVNTAQHITDDLSKAAIRVYSKITSDDETITPVIYDEKFKALDDLPLPLILSSVLNAQKVDKFGKWKLADNSEIFLNKNTWYHPETDIRGDKAISLLTFNLARLAEVDYYNRRNRSELENQAVALLSKHFEELSETPVEPEPKQKPAAKRTQGTREAWKNGEIEKTVETKKAPVKKVVAKKTAPKKTTPVAKKAVVKPATKTTTRKPKV